MFLHQMREHGKGQGFFGNLFGYREINFLESTNGIGFLKMNRDRVMETRGDAVFSKIRLKLFSLLDVNKMIYGLCPRRFVRCDDVI